jgi:hypothetical protein
MAKHLMLGTEASQTWRLPPDTDLRALQNRIQDCMTRRSVMRVSVELGLGDRPVVQGQLMLNGATLVMAAVVESPDALEEWADLR